MEIKFDIGDKVYFTDTFNILGCKGAEFLIYRGEVQAFTVNKKGIKYKIRTDNGIHAISENKVCKTINEIRTTVEEAFQKAITIKSKEIDKQIEDFVIKGVAGKIKKKVSKYNGEYDIKSGGKSFNFTDVEVDISTKIVDAQEFLEVLTQGADDT